MKRKALIGFDLKEYPEVAVFKKYFDCDFCEYDEEYFLNNIKNYSILIPHLYINLTKELLDRATNLDYIFTPSTGTNHLDIASINENNINFFCLSDSSDFIKEITSTAELAWLLILAANRKILQLTNRILNEKSWKNNDIRGFQLKNKTIGIIGFGRLGQIIYKYAKSFNMNILIYDIDQSKTAGYEKHSSNFENLIRNSDIITLHPKLNKTSYEMINKTVLSNMKDGVIIINTSRGDVINSYDLLTYLKNGKVGFAALDVLKNEFHSGKLPDDPLIEFALEKDNSDKILLTPHAGGATLDAHKIVFKHVAKTLMDKINE
jgi:D-3-phosphoglycerate dehydrogenase